MIGPSVADVHLVRSLHFFHMAVSLRVHFEPGRVGQEGVEHIVSKVSTHLSWSLVNVRSERSEMVNTFLSGTTWSSDIVQQSALLAASRSTADDWAPRCFKGD